MTRNNTTARKIALNLVKIFNERKVPESIKGNTNCAEGFTKANMQGNPDSLFRMIILAAYDRQPFTIAAGGWEPIWGREVEKPSLPSILRNAGIFDLKAVLQMGEEDIKKALSGCSFFGRRIDTDDHTHFEKTFKQVADCVGNNPLLDFIESAKTAEEIKMIHKILDKIHGIGPTIASKIIMYTLREIDLANINYLELYSAVQPILSEYHNARLAKALTSFYDEPNIMDLVFDELKVLGDPFAVDALYYIDREAPELRKMILDKSFMLNVEKINWADTVVGDFRERIIVDEDNPVLATKALRDRYTNLPTQKKYAGLPHLGSSESEDALTWNVFRGLQKTGSLNIITDRLGIGQPKALLTWTLSPVVDGISSELQYNVGAVIRKFDGILPGQVTEPDVILLANDAIVVIECKLSDPESAPSHLWEGLEESVNKRCPGYRKEILGFIKETVGNAEIAPVYQLVRLAFYAIKLGEFYGIAPILVSLANERNWQKRFTN